MAEVGRIKIRVPSNISKGDVIRVRVLVIHPMERIQREDGKVVEKDYNFIHEVVATYGGQEVFRAETTQAVSENPFFTFPLKVTASGTLKVTFKDTSGQTYEKTVTIEL